MVLAQFATDLHDPGVVCNGIRGGFRLGHHTPVSQVMLESLSLGDQFRHDVRIAMGNVMRLGWVVLKVEKQGVGCEPWQTTETGWPNSYLAIRCGVSTGLF